MRLFDMDSREDYLLDGKYKVATPYAPCVDVVEVVRCGECRHRDLFSCPLADNDFQKDDDYCSWGERREDGEE